MPWARVPEISFLLTPEVMRNVLAKAGFAEVSWADKTDAGVIWSAEMQTRQKSSAAQPPLGLHVVMGPQFAEMIENLGRNLREGRVGLVQAIMTKAPWV